MKRILSIAALTVLASQVSTQAQTQSAPPPAQKTLAATMNVYVFPTQGQVANVQSQDEAACYQWAVQNSGVDPFQLQKQAEQQTAAAQQQAAAASSGAGVKGAAKGAATGALIGGIAGDAGTGAAVGASAGLIAGRSKARGAQQQAQQQAASTQKATAQQIDNFKKAFSVCLEAKHYLVKF